MAKLYMCSHIQLFVIINPVQKKLGINEKSALKDEHQSGDSYWKELSQDNTYSSIIWSVKCIV